jgi:hypothetical protein
MRKLAFTLAAALVTGALLTMLALGAPPAAAGTTIAAGCIPVFPGVVQVSVSGAVPAGSKVTITTTGPGVPPAPATTTLQTSVSGVTRIDYQLSSPAANGCAASISTPGGAASSSSSGSSQSGHGGGSHSGPHCSADKKVCGNDCIKASDACHKH